MTQNFCSEYVSWKEIVGAIKRKKLGRNPRSDRDLCKKGNKSLKNEIKVLKINKSPNRKGKIKVQIEKGSNVCYT